MSLDRYWVVYLDNSPKQLALDYCFFIKDTLAEDVAVIAFVSSLCIMHYEL